MAANATAASVLVERLLDDLGDVDEIIWKNDPLDRAELRDRMDKAIRIACATLDVLEP